MLWNKEINSFFVQGRHLKVSVFITTQHVKGLGPMIRGNMDLAIFQPIYNLDARKELHNLYAGFADRNAFVQMMDEVVLSENLPGSTPKEPNLRVRILIALDFENTVDPSKKFKWWEAYDPGPFRLCDPAYWKEEDNRLTSENKPRSDVYDPCEELDDLQAITQMPPPY